MIIIGYQGIGKSSVAKEDPNRIDLESSNFWYNGKRNEDWYIYYCQMAMDLSRQGYTVFVSSHEVVRKFLAENNTTEPVYVIFPDKSLKNEWIERLKRRYYDSNLNKDYKAWKNAEDRFSENITELEQPLGNFKIRHIISTNYDLNNIVRQCEFAVMFENIEEKEA